MTRTLKAEKHVFDLQDRFQTILETSSEGIYGIDIDGRVTFCNKSAANILGWLPEDLIGKKQHDIIHYKKSDGSHYPLEECPIYAAITDGKIYQVKDEVFWSKNGNGIHVEYTSTPVYKDGKINGAVVVFKDITERIKNERLVKENILTESALESTALRLMKTQEMAHLGSWEYNYKKQESYWSDEVYSILGVDFHTDQGLYNEYLSAVHPEDRKLVKDAYFNSIKNRLNEYEIEHRIKKRTTGEIRYVREKCRHIRDENNNLIISEGLIHDITDLKTEQERFEQIFAQSPNALFIVDESHVITLLNAKAVEMFGYSEKELKRMDINTLVPERYREQHLKYMNSYMQHMIKIDVGNNRGVYCLRKDGSEFPAEIALSPIKFDSLFYVLVTVTDITERVRAKERELSLGKILDESINEVYIFDVESLSFISVNKSARINLGYTMEELKELTPFDLKPHMDAKRFTALTQPLKNGKVKSVRFETVHSRKDGSIYPVEVQLQLSKFQSQISYVAMIQDITERKKNEEEVRNLTQQLLQSQKMQAVGQLTAGIAHDFNNILASVLGYSELSLECISNNNYESIKDYINNIMVAGQRGRDLVGKMMAFSRKNDAEIEKTDTKALLDEVMKMMSSTIPETITLSYEFQDDIPWIMSNPGLLQQAIVNLIINARDAIRKKGNISIALKKYESNNLYCSACHKKIFGNFVMISITDTGEGIDSSILPFIFDPFFTTKEVNKGTGMGLAMVHGIIHDLNGHILVKSEKYMGTSIKLVLPATDPDLALTTETGTSQTVVKGTNSTGNILIVDDEKSITDLKKAVLISKGFNVTTYNESKEALKNVEEMPNVYNLIISDYSMPDMSGTELAENIFAINPEIPVIIVTGYNDSTIQETNNIKKILNKPVSNMELYKTIIEFME